MSFHGKTAAAVRHADGFRRQEGICAGLRRALTTLGRVVGRCGCRRAVELGAVAPSS